MKATEKTYRIKPLIWFKSEIKTDRYADTLLGSIFIYPGGAKFQWSFRGETFQSNNIAAAKKSAEAHYRARLEQALEVVK